ncbi:phage late control D family protein [Streptomyces chartreusis]|uniref:phage late control D family protein n=1 Tax=Streptomyces TaxID=1883 RepID=UPI000F7357FA|nr:phage late control D family protein [Streptomyces sp. WAC 05379]RSO09630.1 type IV secretion protein Rhs [Streptomyces sp. WAC 05379]
MTVISERGGPGASGTTALPSDTYAPAFLITVEGAPGLSDQLPGCLLDIQVVRELDKSGTFSLTLSNWHEERRELRFDDPGHFSPGQLLQVRLGYAGEGRLPVVAKGQVTTVQPDFPAAGPPTVQISCQDRTAQMKSRKPRPNEQKQFEKVMDWEVAKVIAQRHDLPLVAEEEGVQHPLVVQKNQDDIAFLLDRAKGIDREVFVAPDPSTGQEKLYFVRPADGRPGPRARTTNTFDLWYAGSYTQGPGPGRAPVPNLISFRPTLTLSGQVAAVTVRGWDPVRKQAIVGRATQQDLRAERDAGRSGPEAAAEEMGDREEVIVDRPVSSQQEARALAESVLRARSYAFVRCAGQLVGVPALAPGDTLRIGGVGARFGGTYYTTKVAHSFNSSGFLTSFEARRTSEGR